MDNSLDEPVATGEGLIGRAFDRITGSQLTAGNSIRLLLDAEQNYPAWLLAISAAQNRIHFENYIVAADAVGRLFADALIARARAGVTVRLLYDWLGSFAWTSSAYWSRLRDAGVEVRCYNPPGPSMPTAWLHRDHRKVITIDGEIGFVSGLCVADIWLGDPKKGKTPWRDSWVAVKGPAVADIDRAFAESWAAAGGRITVDEERIRLELSGSAPVRVLGESPGRYQTDRVDQLIACLACRSLWLAFTDAVLAIAITIMVIDLRVPPSRDWGAIKPVIPLLVAYALAYINIGIFWTNHHHMLATATRVNGRALGQLVPPPLLADLDALRDPLDRPCRSHGAIRCRLRGRDGVGSFRLALALARIDPGGGHRIAHSSRRGVAQEGMGQLLSLWPWRPGGLHLAMDCDSALRRGFLHLDGPGPPV
jgi:hypothetical protein